MRKNSVDEVFESDEADGNRWMVSYADFMTLLMAFFVVMYSLSQVSDDHFRVLSESFDKAFNASKIQEPLVDDGVPQNSFSQSPIDLEGNALLDNPGQIDDQPPDNFMPLQEVDQQKFEADKAEAPADEEYDEKWIQISLPSEVLFAPAEARLGDGADALIEEVAEKLAGNDFVARIEGYTDNQPIESSTYASNWELSAARAVAVVKKLTDFGIDPGRLSAVGHGEYQPIATNRTPEGRAQNRRILVSISTEGPSRDRWLRMAEKLRDEKLRRPAYELRPELPEGVKVYGLDTDPEQVASQWLNNRLQDLVVATDAAAGLSLDEEPAEPGPGQQSVTFNDDASTSLSVADDSTNNLVP